MTNHSDMPPAWAPTISRFPPGPEADRSGTVLMVVGVVIVVFVVALMLALPANEEEMGPVMTACMTLLFSSIGLAFFWIGARVHRAQAAFPALLAAHEARCARLVPTWARLEKSDFGASRMRRNGDDNGPGIFVGYEMQLELSIGPSPGSYRDSAPSRRVACRIDCHTHVTTQLLEGTWLAVACDPVSGEIHPQLLVTRDGAKVPLDPVFY